MKQIWLESYLGHEGFNLPDRIEAEFRRYLEFGILAYGFMRASCGWFSCGLNPNDRFVEDQTSVSNVVE